jgi:hypothetical protein
MTQRSDPRAVHEIAEACTHDIMAICDRRFRTGCVRMGGLEATLRHHKGRPHSLACRAAVLTADRFLRASRTVLQSQREWKATCVWSHSPRRCYLTCHHRRFARHDRARPATRRSGRLANVVGAELLQSRYQLQQQLASVLQVGQSLRERRVGDAGSAYSISIAQAVHHAGRASPVWSRVHCGRDEYDADRKEPIKEELMPAVALVKNSSHPLAALATTGRCSYAAHSACLPFHRLHNGSRQLVSPAVDTDLAHAPHRHQVPFSPERTHSELFSHWIGIDGGTPHCNSPCTSTAEGCYRA